MGKVDGKVAFITGAARGQGRSHALLLAEEGADIIGIDICSQVATVGYPMATPEDLEETTRLVEKTGRRMIATQCDVRDLAGLKAAVTAGVAELGRLDIVVANAGVLTHTMPPVSEEQSVAAWRDGIDIMLTGVWNTLQAVVPTLVEQGQGGSIILTSSTAGLRGFATDGSGGPDAYYAAKHALSGLCKAYSNSLGPKGIRVNTIHPTGVATPMIMNDFFPQYIAANPAMGAAMQNPIPVPAVEAIDVSRAVLYLASEDGRYVSGGEHRIDAGLVAFH